MSDPIDTIPSPPDTLPEGEAVFVPPWLDHVLEGGREAVAICTQVLEEVRRASANSDLTREAVNGLADELRSHLSNHDRELAELRKVDGEQGRTIARILKRMETLEHEMAEVRGELRDLVGDGR